MSRMSNSGPKPGSGKRKGKGKGFLNSAENPVVVDPECLLNHIFKNEPDALSDAITYEDHPNFINVMEKLPVRDIYKKTPIEAAAIVGRTNCALAIVNSEREDVNRINSFGYSPLHLGAAWGRTELVKRLVECGADMQQRTERGM